MKKLDLRKELKHLYQPSQKSFSLIDVPPMNALMIDGTGDPNTSPEYVRALEWLYALSYTLKFDVRKKLGVDYPVLPSEGLWWAEDMTSFRFERRQDWKWTMLICQPDLVTPELVQDAVPRVVEKRHAIPPSSTRFERFSEGLCIQIMYIGPYSAEGPTIDRMHTFIRDSGYTPNGKHHEIYLGDPRRTAPEKLKTVVRQPIRKA
jgi:hypothetical protein